MRTKNKRLISLLLTLAMVLGLMSGLTVTAWADVYEASVGDTQYTSLSEALNAWTDGSTLTLLRDVTTANTITVESGNKMLDLNDHGIRMTSSKPVIRVSAGASLTITDDSNEANRTTRYITLAGNYIHGTAVSDSQPGSGSYITVTGGYITGGTAEKEGNYYNGGGVYNNGTLTLEDGTICGNTAGRGGGVYNQGIFTMSGGAISNNTRSYGAGVYNLGTFTMNAGTISENTASQEGGGVDNVYGSTFTMNGGTIIGNSGSWGGGVRNEGSFTMNEGEISGNIAVQGSGINTKNGTFTMNSGVIIASGSAFAIEGKVKNSIAGTGWTDANDDATATPIAISNSGQDLSSYQKVHFVIRHITINSSEHGTVTSSVDSSTVTSAEKGTTVTLTVAPDEGCRLKSISVTGISAVDETLPSGDYDTKEGTYFKAEGKKWSGKWRVGGSTYSLTISSLDQSGISKVELVAANYLGPSNNRNINDLHASAGTVTTNGITEGSVVTVDHINNSTVSLTNANDGSGTQWSFSSVKVYGEAIVSLNLEPTQDNNVKTFTMIDSDVTVSAEFEEISHIHNFAYVANGDVITATCDADDCPLPVVSGDHTATLTIAAPAEGGGAATLTGASDFAGVTVSAIEYSSDNGSSWTNNVPAGNGFYQARVTVAESYIASVSYGVNAIHKAATENGSFSVPTVAAVNADITIETSPDTGYELESLSVTAEGDETLGVTINGNNGSFNMPEENVTVSAIFKKIDYTVTVANDISNGEVAVDKIAANYRDKVTLTVTPAAGYALNTISVTDATGQAITLSNGSFTMPASNVTVAANFGALKTYTIFYRASGSPSSVQFRTTDSGEGHNMINSAKLGNIDCWAIQVQAAEGKSKFPVAFSTDGGSTWGSLSDRNVVNDIPNDLAEGDAVVIPGEAKAFIVSFLWGDIEADGNGSYYAEEGKSRNFLATTITTNITIADPSKEGYSFLGWDNGKTLIEHPNGTVDISGTTESSIYAARWKQNTSTVKFNLNGGSGSISDATVTYGNKVNAPANPTKDGYSFVRWVVARSVSEKINGKETRLSAGTAFNFSDTEIINDLELKAEWKHVHSYVYLQLSDLVFGGAFNDMLEYAPYVHVKLCTSMDDYCSEAHKFDSNGRCVCGATKPTPTVTLQKTIDNAVESTTQVIKNSVVSISAPQTKNSKQFTKWQYYNGSSWVDLSKNTYTAFVIPTDLEVKAVYSGNAAELSVESFNYKGNIAFYFSYKVPNGYTVVDGGILYGNNAHIRYMDAKQLVANVSGMADIMFPYIPSVEMPVHYDPAKDNAAAKFGAQTIANRMFAEQAVNVSGKSTPLFKKLPSFGKSGSTAIAINSSGSNIYYYGMGYVICKAPNGQYAVFMTDAIAATKANPNASTTKTINVQ